MCVLQERLLSSGVKGSRMLELFLLYIFCLFSDCLSLMIAIFIILMILATLLDTKKGGGNKKQKQL